MVENNIELKEAISADIIRSSYTHLPLTPTPLNPIPYTNVQRKLLIFGQPLSILNTHVASVTVRESNPAVLFMRNVSSWKETNE